MSVISESLQTCLFEKYDLDVSQESLELLEFDSGVRIKHLNETLFINYKFHTLHYNFSESLPNLSPKFPNEIGSNCNR